MLSTASGATVTFLLRSPSVFDNDEVIQEHVKSGKARLVKGDALVKDDVKRAWDEGAAGEGKPVDLLLCTVGKGSVFASVPRPFSLTTPLTYL